MTHAPQDPDRVDPTNQSGRSGIGLLVLVLIFAALGTMAIIAVTIL